MRYFRCQCGTSTAYSSMGTAACDVCPDCHTTLAESPLGHSAPEPHRWEERWKNAPANEPPKRERICTQCGLLEDIPDDSTDAAAVSHPEAQTNG